MKIQGTFTALITPFNDEGIDITGFRENLRYQVESGIDGVLVLGSTGEAPTLTPEEEKTLIQIAIEEAKGSIPVLVGTGTNATHSTIKKTKLAEELGADGALIIAPYYNRPTQEGIYLHFAALSESVQLPLYVYNNPRRTSVDIQIDTLKKIAALPHICGVKEASGNILQMQEEIQQISSVKEGFSVVSGDDIFTYPLLALGGDGVISTTSNLIPKEMKALTSAPTLEEARKIHYQWLPLFHALGLEVNPIPIKAAMTLCGMAAGPCRLPLSEMTPHNQERLRQTLATMAVNFETLTSV